MEGSTRKTTSLFGDMLSNAWKAEKVVAKTLHQLPIHVILMKVLYHTVHKNPAAVGRWAKVRLLIPKKISTCHRNRSALHVCILCSISLHVNHGERGRFPESRPIVTPAFDDVDSQASTRAVFQTPAG